MESFKYAWMALHRFTYYKLTNSTLADESITCCMPKAKGGAIEENLMFILLVIISKSIL
jgi:hypothetical protein